MEKKQINVLNSIILSQTKI